MTVNAAGKAERKADDLSRLKSRFPLSSIPDGKTLFTEQDIKGLDTSKDLGTPGEFPFTRGPYKTMYTERPWTIRMFSGFGTAKDTNQRFKYLLKTGQTGLSVAFDMPTLMGYDSDNPRSIGEVGREGVAVCTLDDMLTLFDGIPLDQVSTSMTINPTAPIIFAMYLAVAQKQGVPFSKVRGTIQNDILKEYIAQKEFIFPPIPSIRMITDVFEFCSKHVPKFNTISVSGYHIREAGSTAIQELAFTLANGFTYVEFGMKAGLNVDDFAPRISFFFNSHMNFFEEIAKFRAARRIWAKRMRYKYGAKNPESWRLRFHTQTAGCSLTAQNPENNIVRTAIEALAAVLGGTQSLHTNSMDEALALPTEYAVKIAVRTQQILQHETGLTEVVDPLAGSYFIEWLTNKMEEEAEKIFKKLDELGGMVEAIEKGWPQREIAKAAYEFQKAIEERRYINVGVNEFVDDNSNKVEIPILKIDLEVEKEQVRRVSSFKRTRDGAAVKAKLEEIKEAAKDPTKNLMPRFLDAVNAHVTLGEIVEVLKECWGTWREPAGIL